MFFSLSTDHYNRYERNILWTKSTILVHFCCSKQMGLCHSNIRKFALGFLESIQLSSTFVSLERLTLKNEIIANSCLVYKVFSSYLGSSDLSQTFVTCDLINRNTRFELHEFHYTIN